MSPGLLTLSGPAGEVVLDTATVARAVALAAAVAFVSGDEDAPDLVALAKATTQACGPEHLSQVRTMTAHLPVSRPTLERVA